MEVLAGHVPADGAGARHRDRGLAAAHRRPALYMHARRIKGQHMHCGILKNAHLFRPRLVPRHSFFAVSSPSLERVRVADASR